MKALVAVHYQRPPHALIADIDALNVDRLLTCTGRGAFAFDVINGTVHRHVLKHGRIVVIKSTEGGMPYVGVIKHTEANAATGTVEVSGDNYASVLYGMALNRTEPYGNRGAGRIAERLLQEAQGMGRSAFIEPAVTTGATLQGEIDFGTQHLGSALDALAKRVDEEWWIEHAVTRQTIKHYLRWEKRRGVRKYDPLLQEGIHFTGTEYKTDAIGAVRSAVAVGGGGPVGARTSVAVAQSAAGALGKAEQVHPLTLSGGPSPSTSPLIARDVIEHRPLDTNTSVLADVARRALERPSTAAETLKFTVISDVGPKLYPGDWYRCRWYSINSGLDRWVRIAAIQPDDSTGEYDVVIDEVA